MNIYKRDTSLPFMESVSITAFMRYGPRKGAPRIPDLVESENISPQGLAEVQKIEVNDSNRGNESQPSGV
ncbi:uncharacterized protein PHALS_04949 [Plasmopara halstedii]|uniref:Uncharacterized protein n=1 Tax=Plasmopara halstedii TaxID=4781 RepID=A0A0P1AAG4_PLAHL|nr:uncharacterized protein PHALS_04949 [Plasmopara halstedii]CEG37352.1 hypothetical protein PHALS_04949 [Plasmopara halstedii]|eukprot:XP_024573721.1 hypothetical protein PHALS_04949 [Plasmopara halstedii]